MLSAWLDRTTREGAPAAFADQAEQRVFWDIDALLESELVSPLHADYAPLLEGARADVRDRAE